MNLRNLAIWGAIAMALLAAYSFMGPQTQTKGGRPAEISYSELLRRVDAGEVKEVTINGDRVDGV